MEFKTSEIVSVYKTLSESKLTKLETSDKAKVLKAMRAMKPVADEWESFIKTVDEKIQKENHQEIIEKVAQWQKEGENTTLSEGERIEINKYLIEYQREKDTCINDELEKKVNLEFAKISESAFEKLVDSNDWEVKKMMEVESFIKE